MQVFITGRNQLQVKQVSSYLFDDTNIQLVESPKNAKYSYYITSADTTRFEAYDFEIIKNLQKHSKVLLLITDCYERNIQRQKEFKQLALQYTTLTGENIFSLCAEQKNLISGGEKVQFGKKEVIINLLVDTSLNEQFTSSLNSYLKANRNQNTKEIVDEMMEMIKSEISNNMLIIQNENEKTYVQLASNKIISLIEPKI
ncbi:MAG: hypothetical protein ACRDD4_00450 [Culicoidibacterales bacterium]